MKASVQCNVVPATTAIGIPTNTPIATLCHSSTTIPLVSRYRKIVAPDTSATFLKRPSIFFWIENVDMVELIEDLMKTKVPLSTYCNIQEFLTKLCVLFSCFFHLCNGIQYLFSRIFLSIIFLQVRAGHTQPHAKLNHRSALCTLA